MSPRLAAQSNLSFSQVLDIISDGKSYKFSTKGMRGFFFKAAFPAKEQDIQRDGALSASPHLMLYDFTEPNWSIEECVSPI